MLHVVQDAYNHVRVDCTEADLQRFASRLTPRALGVPIPPGRSSYQRPNVKEDIACGLGQPRSYRPKILSW
jgi:hypothetical protein